MPAEKLLLSRNGWPNSLTISETPTSSVTFRPSAMRLAIGPIFDRSICAICSNPRSRKTRNAGGIPANMWAGANSSASVRLKFPIRTPHPMNDDYNRIDIHIVKRIFAGVRDFARFLNISRGSLQRLTVLSTQVRKKPRPEAEGFLFAPKAIPLDAKSRRRRVGRTASPSTCRPCRRRGRRRPEPTLVRESRQPELRW